MDEIRLPEPLAETAIQAQAVSELQSLFNFKQREAHDTMINLIEEIRHCSQLSHYRTAQRHLGEQIGRVDAQAEAAGTRHKQLKKKLGKLPYQQIIDYPTAAGQISVQQYKAGLEQTFYHKLGYQYRMIGDALAWQLYNFQALRLYALGMNQPPGPIAQSRRVGAEAENKLVEEYWHDEGAFALRHDYTNCLRVGDLSIFAPNETPKIREVKANDRSASSRQKQREMRANELFSRQQSLLDGHLLLHRSYTGSSSHGKVQTNLVLLEHALKQTLQQGIGSATNPYLEIAVLNFMRNPAHRPFDQLYQEWEHRLNTPVASELWPLDCTDILRCDSRQRIQYPCFGAPYTIYPLLASLIADILAGYLFVHYRVNTAAIVHAFQAKGFEARCLLGEWREQGKPLPKKVEGPCFRLHKKGITIDITRLAIEQMTFEGVPLEDMIDSIDAFVEQLTMQRNSTHAPGDLPQYQRVYSFSTYSDTEVVWRTSRNVVTSPNEWRSGQLFVVSS